MLNKIKGYFNTEEKRRVVSNFFSLAVLQGANYLLPLITFPYLVRVLGVNNFGVLAFSTATIAYFQIITDYGFNFTATKEVSVHRDDKDKLQEIFSSVMIIKTFLMVISFIALCVLVFSIERFQKDWLIYLLTFGTVVGQVLFPVWFFQGMERMKYITYLNVLSKIIFTLSIFIFVHDKSDVYLVPLLTSIGFITAGLYSLYLVKKEFDVSFAIQESKILKMYLSEGWDVFMQRFYVSLYTTTNTIVLGLLTNNLVVGYYSIAAKLIDVFRQFFTIISQVFFPFFSRKVNENKVNSFAILFKLSKAMLLISGVSLILITLFGDYILHLISGEKESDAIEILNILSVGLIVVPFGSLYTSALIAIGKGKDLNRIAKHCAIISLPMSYVLINQYGAIGLAGLVVGLQYYITIKYFLIVNTYYKLNVKV